MTFSSSLSYQQHRGTSIISPKNQSPKCTDPFTMSPYHLTLLLITIPHTTTNNKGLLSFLFNSCNCRKFTNAWIPFRATVVAVVSGCGVPNRAGKLIGGEYVDAHEFPWLVLVHVVGKKTSVGSLINSKYVVTTANVIKG